MRMHKMVIIKAKPGHNPMKPLCDTDDWAAFMARDWKEVTCKHCFKIKKQEKKLRKVTQRVGGKDG